MCQPRFGQMISVTGSSRSHRCVYNEIMVNMLACLLGIGIILISAEILWRYKHVPIELSRKFVHMSVGAFVAYWPWVLTWWQIRAIAVAFVVGVVISKHFKLFKAIHNVNRTNIGEIAFAVGILLATFIAKTPWQFTLAVLLMAIADGLAALVGSRYIKVAGQRYRIFGCDKTWAGSLTFFATSCLIIWGVTYFLVSPAAADLMYAAIIPIALILTVIEACSSYGVDNISVPLTVILLSRIVLI